MQSMSYQDTLTSFLGRLYISGRVVTHYPFLIIFDLRADHIFIFTHPALSSLPGCWHSLLLSGI